MTGQYVFKYDLCTTVVSSLSETLISYRLDLLGPSSTSLHHSFFFSLSSSLYASLWESFRPAF